MPEERNINEEYNEINLMDYIKVILRRKRLILAVFLISIITAGVVSLYLPKVYKIDTSLEIGKITEKTIESPEQIAKKTVEKIKGDVFGILVRKELELTEMDYPEIKVSNPENTDLVNIKIESDQVQQAKNVLEAINRLVLDEHQKMVIARKKVLEKEIEFLKENINIPQKNIIRVQAKVVSLKKEQQILENKVSVLQEILIYEQTPGTQFALFDTEEKLEKKIQETEDCYLQINSLEVTINSLKNKINVLEDQIEDIRPTRILKSPAISESPVSPKLLSNIVLAAVLGIFMGIFLAFFKEWWIKTNENKF